MVRQIPRRLASLSNADPYLCASRCEQRNYRTTNILSGAKPEYRRGITTCINYRRHYADQIRNRRIGAYPISRSRARTGMEHLLSIDPTISKLLCRLFLFNYSRQRARAPQSSLDGNTRAIIVARETLTVTRAILPIYGIIIFCG